MKIMLIGGINDAKAGKLIKLIHDNVSKDAEVINVNKFTQTPADEVSKENPDVILMLDKGATSFTQPTLDGLALIYPQMGQKKLFEEIKKYL